MACTYDLLQKGRRALWITIIYHAAVQDALQIATILALLWLVANAWWQLEHIK